MNGKFKKVLQDIENTYDTGKIPSRMTLYEFRVMENIFMELCKSKKEKTLYLNVASYLQIVGGEKWKEFCE